MSATTSSTTPTTTTQTVPTPITDRAINVAQGVAGLAEQAETIPIVKTTLEAQFATLSHTAMFPFLAAAAGMIGSNLSEHHITVDNQLIVVALGGLVTGAAYVWQWAMIRWNKPVAVTAAVTTTTTKVTAP